MEKKKIKEPVLGVILKNSKIGELEELVTVKDKAQQQSSTADMPQAATNR